MKDLNKVVSLDSGKHQVFYDSKTSFRMIAGVVSLDDQVFVEAVCSLVTFLPLGFHVFQEVGVPQSNYTRLQGLVQ